MVKYRQPTRRMFMGKPLAFSWVIAGEVSFWQRILLAPGACICIFVWLHSCTAIEVAGWLMHPGTEPLLLLLRAMDHEWTCSTPVDLEPSTLLTCSALSSCPLPAAATIRATTCGTATRMKKKLASWQHHS
jgi:hypothetical protein